MTTFNTKRNETKNYREIILPPYLKPSQLWIAEPRHEYCDRNDNYSSTHQEKQFAGSPIFVSTFQGGLPRIDQVSPAAPPPWTTALLNTPFPQNTPASAMPQGHPGSASASSFWLCVRSLQPSSMASQTRPVLQPPPPHRGSHKPRSRMQWTLGKPNSRPSAPSGALMCPRLCHTCGISIPCWTSITSVAVPCSEHIFSVTETQHEAARKTEILFCLCSEVQHAAYQTRGDSTKP